MEENGHVKIYNGNYSSYRLELEDARQQSKKDAGIGPQKAAPVAKNKLSFKETKELETLESEIIDIENDIKDKNDQLNVVGIDPNKLNDLLDQIAKLNSRLDGKSIRWIELTELKEA
jgi:ATP-binding cassette subfamily F protein uup